uniref:Uncharacterized protein n=1 Tax=Arundo donax TaxID=35708 RepID=A0A0A8ZUR5_ARUDO
MLRLCARLGWCCPWCALLGRRVLIRVEMGWPFCALFPFHFVKSSAV